MLHEACDPDTGTTADAQRAAADAEFCDHDCTIPRCGDGYVNAAGGEQCDEILFNAGQIPPPTATCDSDCTFPECGDGFENAEAGEECDDGNTNSGDGCDALCQDE